MHANAHLVAVFLSSLLVMLISACISGQKAFDQMTAQEHRDAAAHENQLADSNFAKVHSADITPPETLPTGEVYNFTYAETNGAIPYNYDYYHYEVGAADAYIAWPRVNDPSERHADAASKHREKALRHERAAAALEGRPSPQPLPPDRT